MRAECSILDRELSDFQWLYRLRRQSTEKNSLEKGQGVLKNKSKNLYVDLDMLLLLIFRNKIVVTIVLLIDFSI